MDLAAWIWGLIGVVGIVLSISFGVLQLNDFKLAKRWFLFAAIIAWVEVLMWGWFTTSGNSVRYSLVFIASGLIGAALLGAFDYVNKKHNAKAEIDAKQIVETKSELPKPNPQIKFEAHVMPTDPQYPSRKKFAGISWRKNYSDVRLNITNGSIPIQNVDLYVSLDTHIAAIGQISEFTGVNTFPEGMMPSVSLGGIDEKGKPITMPIIPIVKDSPSPIYRIQIERISSNTVLQFIIAGIALNPPKPNGGLPDTLFAQKEILK